MYERFLSYNKLWKLLIDKKMSHADFRRAGDFSTNTLSKLRRDDEVAMSILKRICDLLDCNIGDICDYIKADETGESK